MRRTGRALAEASEGNAVVNEGRELAGREAVRLWFGNGVSAPYGFYGFGRSRVSEAYVVDWVSARQRARSDEIKF